jgi:hypothetical protein
MISKLCGLYLPAGAIVGAVFGVIIGGYVCQPATAYGGLCGMLVGAAVSSWRRTGDFELARAIATSGLFIFGLWALCSLFERYR